MRQNQTRVRCKREHGEELKPNSRTAEWLMQPKSRTNDCSPTAEEQTAAEKARPLACSQLFGLSAASAIRPLSSSAHSERSPECHGGSLGAVGMLGTLGIAGTVFCTVGTCVLYTKKISSVAISSTALITTISPVGKRRLPVLVGSVVDLAGLSSGTTGAGPFAINCVYSLGPALALMRCAAPPNAESGVELPLLKIGGGKIPGAEPGSPANCFSCENIGEACAAG